MRRRTLRVPSGSCFSGVGIGWMSLGTCSSLPGGCLAEMKNGGSMSTENIISVTPVGEAEVWVTFACRDGETRVYAYTGLDAARVLAGADPANLSGERVS